MCAALVVSISGTAVADITGAGSVVDLTIEGFSDAGSASTVSLINGGETHKGSGPDNTFPNIVGTNSFGKEVIGEWYEQDRTDGGSGSLVVIRMHTEDLSPLVPDGQIILGRSASHFSIRVGSADNGGLPFQNWVERVRLTGFSMSASNDSQTLFRRATDDPNDVIKGQAQATIDTIEDWDGIVQGGFWSGVFGDPFFIGSLGGLGDWHTMTMVLEVEAIPAPAGVAAFGCLAGLASSRRRRS
jgi:hypothetical protein